MRGEVVVGEKDREARLRRHRGFEDLRHSHKSAQTDKKEGNGDSTGTYLPCCSVIAARISCTREAHGLIEGCGRAYGGPTSEAPWVIEPINRRIQIPLNVLHTKHRIQCRSKLIIRALNIPNGRSCAEVH